VFVTAYDQYALQAFEAQAVDYLVKPVDAERLAACVARLQARLAERAAARQPASAEAAAQAALRRRWPSCARCWGHAAARGRPPPRLEVIQAQVGNLVHLVPVDEVLYFEAADKYVRVVTAEREHLIRCRCASCCRSSTRSASGRCTAAPWCRRAASPARGARSRARSRSRCAQLPARASSSATCRRHLRRPPLGRQPGRRGAPRRPGARPGAHPHALPARAQRLPARRPRQEHLPELRPGARLRRHLPPALRRHQPREGRAGVRRRHHRDGALAGLRLGHPAAAHLYYASDYFDFMYRAAER
jgi:hypothetical protein